MNFRVKICEGNVILVSSPELADGEWFRYSIPLKDEKVSKFFYENLLELTIKNQKDSDSAFSGVNIAFSTRYPGVPFFTTKNCTYYKDQFRNGGKQMILAAASSYGIKRTKSWKIGHRYLDSLGNNFTIIGKYFISSNVYDLLTDSLAEEKSAKRKQSDRSFVKAVVDILNSDYNASQGQGYPLTSKSEVYLYIKDNCTDFSSLNERGLDVYDDLRDFTIQIIPTSSVYPAFEIEEVYKEDVRNANPLDIKKIAENTLKMFKFGEYSENDSDRLRNYLNIAQDLGNRVPENLIYLSAMTTDGITANTEVVKLLETVVKERLKECLLFDSECINPKVSYDKSIDTLSIIKRSAIFISRIIKHNSLFEKALNYISSIINLTDLLEKTGEEVKEPAKYLFDNWENYKRYINFSSLPYVSTPTPMKLTMEVSDSTFMNNISLNEVDRIKIGNRLSEVIESLMNIAIKFDGVGVQSYYTLQKELHMTITYNDIRNYLGDNMDTDEQLKVDILTGEFYKLDLIIELKKKDNEVN
jgi:hypothetical protein